MTFEYTLCDWPSASGFPFVSDRFSTFGDAATAPSGARNKCAVVCGLTDTLRTAAPILCSSLLANMNYPRALQGGPSRRWVRTFEILRELSELLLCLIGACSRSHRRGRQLAIFRRRALLQLPGPLVTLSRLISRATMWRLVGVRVVRPSHGTKHILNPEYAVQ